MCMNRYFEYTELLKHTGKEGSAYRKLNVYCVEHLEGDELDTVYVAQHLVDLQKALGLERGKLLKQFNQWPDINWGEISAQNEYVKEVKNYVHQDFFEAYRDYSGSFSDSIIRLGVESMGLQNTGFLAKSQQVQQGYNRMVTTLVVDDYWKAFVQTYLGTKYMPQASASLTNEAVTMLQWLYDHNEMKESALLDAILGYADVVTLKSYLHTMLNDHFAKTDINIVKFSYFGRMLPMLGSDMDANTARGLMQHFIKPICKDSDCAAIILSNKDFYLAIMYLDTTIAASLVKEIVDLELYAEIAGELREMLPREKKEKI